MHTGWWWRGAHFTPPARVGTGEVGWWLVGGSATRDPQHLNVNMAARMYRTPARIGGGVSSTGLPWHSSRSCGSRVGGFDAVARRWCTPRGVLPPKGDRACLFSSSVLMSPFTTVFTRAHTPVGTGGPSQHHVTGAASRAVWSWSARPKERYHYNSVFTASPL